MKLRTLITNAITLYSLCTHSLCGQTPARDPRALELLTGSSKSLSPSIVINDVTLDASVQYTSGSDVENGAATLLASGNLKSAVTLLLAGSLRQETRNTYAGLWGLNSQGRQMAVQNAVTPASWFFPHLLISAALRNAAYSVSYIGQEERTGATVHHIEIAGCPGLPGEAEFPLDLTKAELYLDAATLLPTALTFNVHPDTDALRNLPVEVDFQNYEPSGEVLAPMHITKLFLNTLLLDFTVTKVTVNSGIADSNFSVAP